MQTIYSGSHPEPGVVVFPSQREPDVEQGATPPSRAQDVVAEVETAERKCDPSQEHPLDEGKLSAWDTVYLALQVTPFALLYVVMFSELGYGATVFKALARSAGAKTFASIGVFVLLLLYVLDAWKWKSSFLQWFRRFSLAVSVFAAFMNLVLSIHTRPWSPLYAYILANILWCAWRRELWYKHVHPARYIASCALVIVTVGVLLLALNLAWAAQTNLWWGKATRQEFRERLRVCQPSFRAPDGSAWCRHYGHGGSACPNGCPELTWASACDPQDDTCLAAFLLYAGPFIVGVTCLLLGTALHVVAMAALPALPPPALQEAASADNQPSLRPNPTPKILVHGLLLCLIGLWLAASIGGASMELSHVFSSLLLLSLATLLAAIVRTFGLDQQLLEQGAMVIIDTKSPSHRVQTADDLDEHDQAAASVAAHSAPSGLVGMVVAVLRSDWVKALCLMTTASFLPFLLALSALKQAVRRWLAPHTQHGDHFSGLGNNILSVLGRWEWGSVLSKTVVLGAVYFVVQVGVLRLTTLALSWLNQHLAGQNLALISLLLYIVGIILLLIPAVPGVPVYLACGVILGAAGTEELGTFGAAMFWAVIVAFVTKMSGSAIQQVVIGGWAGRMVWVRAACKVNSRGIKAMRIILSKPGLTRDKMYILVGGPDWPTSVLTGILGLKVSQMFVGALPIIVPITFVVVSGGCLNYGASDGKWASLSTVFLTVSSATLGSCFFAAVLAIEETAAQCDAEIRAMPDDQEVKALEQTMAEDEKLVGLAMKWSEQSRFERVLLVMAAVVMYMSTAAFVLLSDLCFQTVDLATRFEGPPLYGRISNLIRAPHGWMAMALHVVSIVLYYSWCVGVRSRTERLRRQPRPTTLNDRNSLLDGADQG